MLFVVRQRWEMGDAAGDFEQQREKDVISQKGR